MIWSYLKHFFILNFSCTLCKSITETLLAQSSYICIFSLNVIREAVLNFCNKWSSNSKTSPATNRLYVFAIVKFSFLQALNENVNYCISNCILNLFNLSDFFRKCLKSIGNIGKKKRNPVVTLKIPAVSPNDTLRSFQTNTSCLLDSRQDISF